MINFDGKADKLSKMLAWMGKAVKSMSEMEMIVIWDQKSVDIVPDPYRYEYLKANALKLITVN
jgi:hypothetical protein